MATTTDLGLILKREFPYAHAVSAQFLTTFCSYCCKTRNVGEKLKRCAGCKVLHYCTSNCQKRDWADHKGECSFLSKIAHTHPEFLSNSFRLMSRVFMKSKRDNEPAFNGRTLESLMSHSDELLTTPNLKNEFILTKTGLSLQFGPENLPADAELLELFGKVKINVFSIMYMTSVIIGSGLYIGFSELDHDCDSDVFHDFAGAEMIIRPIKEGITTYHGKLSTSYCSPLQRGSARRGFLKESYFFTCNCERCNDIEWDAVGSSLRCQFCSNGYCPVYLDDRGIMKSIPVCTVCGLVTEADLVAAISLGNELERKRAEVEYGESIENPKLLLAAGRTLFEEGEKTLSCFNISLHRFALVLKGLAKWGGALEFCSYLEEKILICFRHFLPEGDPSICAECLAAGIAHVKARKMNLAKQRLEQALKFAVKVYGRDDPFTKVAQREYSVAFGDAKNRIADLIRNSTK